MEKKKKAREKVDTMFKIIGIHNYQEFKDGEFRKTKLQIENVQSQPRCSERLYEFLSEALSQCDDDRKVLLSDKKISNKSIQRFVHTPYFNERGREWKPIQDEIQQQLDQFKNFGKISVGTQWKLRILVITSHGIITHPQKESCMIYVSEIVINGAEIQKAYKFFNVENFARECATQPETITIIIFNSCRTYLFRQHPELENFIKNNSYFKEETDGSKSQGKDMKGVAIVLFASRTNEASIDTKLAGGSFINIGTDNFIKIVQQCREQGKLGLEFIEKYPESCKTIYSDLNLAQIKALNISVFKPIEKEEEKQEVQQEQMMEIVEEQIGHDDDAHMEVVGGHHSILRDINARKVDREQYLRETINNHVYRFERGILTNDCLEAQKSRPLTEKWKCQGIFRPEKCMSVIQKENVYSDIVAFKCQCRWGHRLCEACFIYYKEDNGKNSFKNISKILILPRRANQALITKAYNFEEKTDYYFTYNPNLSQIQQQMLQMTEENEFFAYYSTVIPLDSRFTFVVGGSLEPEGRISVESENLVLIDTMLGCNKVRFRKDLLAPVIHPACSIFNKRLLFIAGGQYKGEWIDLIQIYDIENGKMYELSQSDKNLNQMLTPLVGPSMAAEFFDTLGLVICGLNPETQRTEVHIYNTKNGNWTIIPHDSLTFDTELLDYSFIGLHLFSFEPNLYYMILAGGIKDMTNKDIEAKDKHKFSYVYKLDNQGSIQFECQTVFYKTGRTEAEQEGDFFPQNQWIVQQEGKSRKMYVLGRRGTYYIEVSVNNFGEIIISQTAYAEQGFDKNLDWYIE